MLPFDSKSFLSSVSHQPGVYRMYNTEAAVIYVGKAKDLKKRLASYFRTNLSSEKTKALVSHINKIDVTVTHTETEALILEHNYIKQYRPKYNVLLRDDKSYPYIFISSHRHPKISSHRGGKRKKGEYFGPYPNSGAVRETLHLIQKLFPIRQCEDSVYANRQRPCLMYQIGRCLAPCVENIISDEGYTKQVEFIRLFLQGKSNQVIQTLIKQMEQASIELKFEKAAIVRDQIQSIRRIQEQQYVSDESSDNVDVLGFAIENNLACIHLLMIRQGKVLGSRSFFPKIPINTEQDEVFLSFLSQYYLNHTQDSIIPNHIVTGFEFDSKELSRALSEITEHTIQFQLNPKGTKGRYLTLANTNAQSALTSKINHKSTMNQRIQLLEETLELNTIQRMECFDISHTMGEKTVASCVVFNREGSVKSEYRRYNINGITGGDDYAAMAQVLERRYSKSLDIDKIPDIIFIDGGKGQLNRAYDIVSQFWSEWPKRPLLLGIAKGVTRKHGLETMVKITGESFSMSYDSPALHLIQHIRDESHKHAITGHRAQRGKVRKTSTLQHIEGIGPKRRQQLLKYLGGLQELKSASVDEIAKVPSISRSLAEKIYDALKDG